MNPAPSPQAATVNQSFIDAAEQWGERPWLAVLPETAAIYGIDAGEISYAEALAAVKRMSRRYATAGYGHGHRVGLLLENRPAFFLHWYALNALGVSVVPINAELRSQELQYLISHSDIVLAVALPERHDALQAAALAAGRQLNLIAESDAPPASSSPAPLARQPVNEESECALLYTSGTTGRPKGCMLSNRYYLMAGRWYAGLGGLVGLRPGVERMLTPLPLVHMNAMAFSAMAMLQTGGCLILLDRFHPASWWNSALESKASVIHYLGVMPSMLMQAPSSVLERQHQVRFGFGAGVDRSLHAAFEQRFGFALLEAWAMTETGAGAVIMASHVPRQVGSNCFGREGPEVLVSLRSETGQPAVVDEAGELLVRHAGENPRLGFFSGYLKDEVASAEAWGGGWFHTGDVVSRDSQGQLHFLDRNRNLIRRSGENISAMEVEMVLNQHPAIRAAAVVATPDELRGDEVLACVVTREPLAPSQQQELAADIVRHALARLAYYKVPGHVAFVDTLPLTASQKIARAEMRRLGASLPGQVNCVDTRALKRRP